MRNDLQSSPERKQDTMTLKPKTMQSRHSNLQLALSIWKQKTRTNETYSVLNLPNNTMKQTTSSKSSEQQQVPILIGSEGDTINMKTITVEEDVFHEWKKLLLGTGT
jgi:hypothetical protein